MAAPDAVNLAAVVATPAAQIAAVTHLAPVDLVAADEYSVAVTSPATLAAADVATPATPTAALTHPAQVLSLIHI